MLNRLFQKIFGLLYLLIKISKINWIKYYNSDSDIIIWVKTNPIFTIKSYLLNNDLLSDFALIESLVENKLKYKVVFGKNIGKVCNSSIFYTVSESCNPYNLADYSGSLFYVANQLSKQGNKLFPKEHELKYWENKGYMQSEFLKHNISHPFTIILDRKYSKSDVSNLEYPLLLKEIHSAGSRGITKILNHEELLISLRKIWDKGHSQVLIQKLVEMRRDLRVVILNSQVTSFYWRVNPSKEWRPTATSFGNNTEFGNFPNKWKDTFISYLKSMDLSTGAFDVAWENDNLESNPLILEVSPFYQLNPSLPKRFREISYKDYKKKLFVYDAYYKKYIDIVFDNQKKITDLNLKD